MSLLLYFLLLATPLVGLVAGFIVPPLLIYWISNQWPSSVEFSVISSTVVLGAIAGGFIGYVLCQNKEQPGGWAWNCLPWLCMCFGLWIGVGVASGITTFNILNC